MVLGSASGEGLRKLKIMTEGEGEPASHMARAGVRERRERSQTFKQPDLLWTEWELTHHHGDGAKPFLRDPSSIQSLPSRPHHQHWEWHLSVRFGGDKDANHIVYWVKWRWHNGFPLSAVWLKRAGRRQAWRRAFVVGCGRRNTYYRHLGDSHDLWPMRTHWMNVSLRWMNYSVLEKCLSYNKIDSTKHFYSLSLNCTSIKSNKYGFKRQTFFF